MRILFIPNFQVARIPHDNPSILSPNKIVGDSAYWFFKHMPDVDVDVLDNRSPFPFDWLSSRSKVETFQALRALVTHGGYDVVLSHSFNAGFAFCFLRSLVGTRLPPHLVIDIGCLNGGRRNPVQIGVLRLALRSVAGIVYHSTANEEFYSEYFRTLRREFVPFGVDPYFFKPLAIKPSNDFVLSIGSTKRDYATLAKAWRHIEFPLKIVGSKLSSIGQPRNVHLVERVPIDSLMEMIHNSVFVVLPLEDVAYSIGQMTLLQCMAMGKTVVVTDVRGVRDYCQDGENCLTIRAGSDSDIIDKVELLLEDTELVRNIASKARQSVISRFNERLMAERIHECVMKSLSA